jgi:hypothetical protein
MSKMATYRLCFATSPESAASLHEQITSEDAGYLAGLAYKDTRLWSPNVPRQWLPTTSLQHSGIAIACVTSISVVLQVRYWKDSRPRSLNLYGIPGTFHPRRWSLACPHCPDSNTWTLNSFPLDLNRTEKADVRLYRHALFSTPFAS